MILIQISQFLSCKPSVKKSRILLRLHKVPGSLLLWWGWFSTNCRTRFGCLTGKIQIFPDSSATIYNIQKNNKSAICSDILLLAPEQPAFISRSCLHKNIRCA